MSPEVDIPGTAHSFILQQACVEAMLFAHESAMTLLGSSLLLSVYRDDISIEASKSYQNCSVVVSGRCNEEDVQTLTNILHAHLVGMWNRLLGSTQKPPMQ
jgi:hypothetical protein